MRVECRPAGRTSTSIASRPRSRWRTGAVEEVAPRGDLARERLAERRQLGIEAPPAAAGPSARSRGRRRRAPASEGPVEVALHEPTRRVGSSGPSSPATKWAPKFARVGVGEDDQVALRRPTATATSRRPCPSTWPELGQQLAPPGGPRRRARARSRAVPSSRPRRRRSPGPPAPLEQHDSRSAIGPIVSATSRRAARPRRRLPLGRDRSRRSRELRVVEPASAGRRRRVLWQVREPRSEADRPWGPLLDCARARTSAWSRPPRAAGRRGRADARGAPPALREALERAGIDGALVPPGATPGTRRGAGTRSSRPARRAASRSCFNLPVLHMLARDPRARALYLYPTKALAQDQARASRAAAAAACATRSTTATRPARSAPRSASASNLCSPTPTCCTSASCPTTRAWGDFLANLAWSWSTRRTSTAACSARTSANVLRRLRRLAPAYGTEPRFVLTQRDDRQPAQLAERLTGLEFELVDRDGAPRGEREIVMCNPPLLDERRAARVARQRGGRAVRRPGPRRACARSAS